LAAVVHAVSRTKHGESVTEGISWPAVAKIVSTLNWLQHLCTTSPYFPCFALLLHNRLVLVPRSNVVRSGSTIWTGSSPAGVSGLKLMTSCWFRS